MPKVSRVERDDFAEAIHSYPRPCCRATAERGIIIEAIVAVRKCVDAAPYHYC
jgi:hypothetical protein